MRRRQFIRALGGAALGFPLAGRAQQATPVIGYFHTRGSKDAGHLIAAFRRGLRDGGFIEGQNV
jgi:putative tryptophan/tyrosine transport system substrate-binding protein